MEHIDIVVKALKESDEPLKGAEISDITGLNRATVDMVIKQLNKEGKLESPKRCYYRLK